jgi:hypothetical protein
MLIDWDKAPDLSDRIRQSLARDPLPDWAKDRDLTVGFWIAETQAFQDDWLAPYDAEGGHLSAFESTVRSLTHGEDFRGGKTLFVSILGVHPASSLGRLNGERLKAGHAYNLTVYHYLNQHDPHFSWKPFWIEVSSDSSQVLWQSRTLRRIEAEYDEVNFPFSIGKEVSEKEVSLNVVVYAGSADSSRDSIMDARLQYTLVSDKMGTAIRVAAIAVGVAGAQLIGLLTLGKLSVVAAFGVIVFSLMAAVASVLRLPMKP